jgi:molybdopterin synthase sulfur carrier subunit
VSAYVRSMATTAPAASVTVLYFAWLRERVGLSEERCPLPPGQVTVADLVGVLAARSPRHAAALRERATIRCAVNQEFAPPSAVVQAGDEVALFPPVTGG